MQTIEESKKESGSGRPERAFFFQVTPFDVVDVNSLSSLCQPADDRAADQKIEQKRNNGRHQNRLESAASPRNPNSRQSITKSSVSSPASMNNHRARPVRADHLLNFAYEPRAYASAVGIQSSQGTSTPRSSRRRGSSGNYSRAAADGGRFAIANFRLVLSMNTNMHHFDAFTAYTSTAGGGSTEDFMAVWNAIVQVVRHITMIIARRFVAYYEYDGSGNRCMLCSGMPDLSRESAYSTSSSAVWSRILLSLHSALSAYDSRRERKARRQTAMSLPDLLCYCAS
jgi:hypothetical protein